MQVKSGKENKKCVYSFYGLDEFGFSEIPCKTSGVWLSKLIKGKEYSCALCFRAGLDLSNSRKHPVERNWKEYRRSQWR